MVASKLGVPIDACLATQKDTFRKPSSGMWEVTHRVPLLNVMSLNSFNVDRYSQALLDVRGN